MDIQKYIASGTLEAYVLGDLSLAEQQEVRAMLDSFPELKVELERIEKDFEAIAQNTGIPPALSFDKIIESSNKEESKGQIISTDNNHITTSSDQSKQIQDSKTISFEKRISKFQRIAIAASIAALVASAVSVNYYSKYKASDSALAAIQAERQEYAENYNVVKNQLTDIEADLAIINNADAERVVLNPTKTAPGAKANLYWNRTTEEVFVSIQNLKQLASDQQYQLWAIIDDQPVDAGTFDWNASGLVKMKSFGSNVQLFAVTIEKRGGSEAPALETMQVKGAPSQS